MEIQATAQQPARGETAAGFDRSIDDYRRRFDSRLSAWLAVRRREIADELPASAELADAVIDLATAGGKRLRPALVHFSHLACGGEPEDAVMPVAMAAELLHTYLLIHDDVMDHAETRRGLPTIHRHFARRHADRGWRGDDAGYGQSAAILAGDLAHTWAVELFAQARPAGRPARRVELDRIFAAMCGEVIGGQFLELTLAETGDGGEEELFQVLRMKSGRYSVERPLELGAVFAGAPAPTRRALALYGRALGEAFQLQDDVLGLYGDPATVGKPVGGDLAEGKYTFLVHFALGASTPEEAEPIRAALGRRDLPPDAARAALSRIEASGAVERVRGMIDERLRAATEALGGDDVFTASGPRAEHGARFLVELVEGMRRRRR